MTTADCPLSKGGLRWPLTDSRDKRALLPATFNLEGRVPPMQEAYSLITCMTDFSDWSKDSGLWVIRHMDGYVRAHKGTVSASVKCFLVAGPPSLGDDPAKLAATQIAAVLSDESASRLTTTE